MSSIKVRDMIGPQIKLKDKAAMRIKTGADISAKAIKGTGIAAIGTAAGAADAAADPYAKDSVQKQIGKNRAAAAELKRELKGAAGRMRPAADRLRMGAEKRIFKASTKAPIKTRTAFSPLLYRRCAYNERYHNVMRMRRSEYIRRFMLPIKKAWNKTQAAKAAHRAKAAMQRKAARVAEKAAVRHTIRLIVRLVQAVKAAVTALVAATGAFVAIPLLALILIVSVLPTLNADAEAYGDGIFVSPYGKTQYTVTARFGLRNDPITGAVTQHNGYDVCAATGEGTPIYAVYDATVRTAYDGSSDSGYGHYVILEIDSDDAATGSLTVLYGHLSGVVVKRGDKVQAGQLIGFEGNTGRSTGSHLHFEVRSGGVPIDAKLYWDL